MSSAVFIKLERASNFDVEVNGQALAADSEILDALAEQLNVTPLIEFYSANPEDLPSELAGIAINWQEKWFEAAEGLVTIRALLSYLESNSVEHINRNRVLEDLQEFEQVLCAAELRNLRWHLEVDF